MTRNAAGTRLSRTLPCYARAYFFFLLGVWARALPAADFAALEVLPSRNVADAALAAFGPVWRFGVPVWDKALPDAVLDLAPVLLLVIVLEALVAALVPVVFLF